MTRAQRALTSDAAIITASAGMQNITWRWVKCHGPNPIRSATGGLAAKLSSTPNPISATSANSNSRSTVHHHSAMGVFRSRENQAEMAVNARLRYAAR